MERCVITKSDRKEKTDGSGDFLRVYIQGKKFPFALFGELEEVYDGPGEYDVDFEKKGKFTNISNLKKAGAAGHPGATAAMAKGAATYRAPAGEDDIMTNRSITAQVCIKAAADITTAVVAKSAKDKFTGDEVARFSTHVAHALMQEARMFVAKKTLPPADPEPEADAISNEQPSSKHEEEESVPF